MIYNFERAEAYRRRAARRAYLRAPCNRIWAHWARVLERHMVKGNSQ